MPVRPPRICSCGKVVSSGIRCECQIARDNERKARHDAKRPAASTRGYDGKWRTERAAYLVAHSACTRCGKPATIVHHKTPHKGDKKLFWQRSNWEAVCKPCHDGPIQAQEKRR